MVFNMVDFWGMKKTARKCVTDFGVRFSKMTRGLHVLRGLFSICVFRMKDG